jgi:hypothetical protein
MSYILEALKKNEKERGVARIPTLMTVHEFEEPRHGRAWIIGGVLLIGAVAASWFLFPYIKAVLQPPQALVTGPAPRHESLQARDTAAKTDAVTPSAVVIPPQTASRTPVEVPAPEQPSAASAAPAGISLQSREAVKAPAPALASQDRQIMAKATTAAGAEAEPNGQSTQQAAADVSPAGAEARIPVAAPAKPASLREAVEAMKISILVYDEKKEERLVFINGRRYAEGEYVEGAYLLESITPDGAVLSHGGDRMLLKLR